MFIGGGLNRDALRLDESAARRAAPARRPSRRQRSADVGDGLGGAWPRRAGSTRSSCSTSDGLLPAIFFIFSRAQCDEAAKACVDAGLVLSSTTPSGHAIAAIVDERLAGLDPDDLDVLGFDRFVRQLEAGIAAHHAGMVPPMKEVVEACFIDGLVKVVFATETLAVGINMPARSVVIEKLTKFTGDHHEQLTPGQYTQLTGRAGRRGLDETGDAIVLWSPWVRFDEVAQLASSSSFHLRSVFRPTYNMAANLIRTHTAEESHRLLNLSFAQFQADRDVVQIEARLERKRAHARREATRGGEPVRRHRRVPAPAASARPTIARSVGRHRPGQMRGAMAKLKPGHDHPGVQGQLPRARRRRRHGAPEVGGASHRDHQGRGRPPDRRRGPRRPPRTRWARSSCRRTSARNARSTARDVAKRLRTAKIGSDRASTMRRAEPARRAERRRTRRGP